MSKTALTTEERLDAIEARQEEHAETIAHLYRLVADLCGILSDRGEG
jgi:hypothetical protein